MSSVIAPPLKRQPDAAPPYSFTGEGKKCDFCDQERDRIWLFPFRGHCISTVLGRYEIDPGYWGACVMCRPLVEGHDLRLLVARIMTIGPCAKEERLPRSVWEAHVIVMYAVLFDCMMPEGPYLRMRRA